MVGNVGEKVIAHLDDYSIQSFFTIFIINDIALKERSIFLVVSVDNVLLMA